MDSANTESIVSESMLMKFAKMLDVVYGTAILDIPKNVDTSSNMEGVSLENTVDSVIN